MFGSFENNQLRLGGKGGGEKEGEKERGELPDSCTKVVTYTPSGKVRAAEKADVLVSTIN